MSDVTAPLLALLLALSATVAVFALSAAVRRVIDRRRDGGSHVPDTGAVPGGRGGPDRTPDE